MTEITDKDCIFCKIVAGEIPSEFLFENDEMIVIKDLNPQAQFHLLGIPKVHRANLAGLFADFPGLAANYVSKLTRLGTDLGDYKLLFNSGAGVGQTVFHCHGHILAGTGLEGSLV
jgi:histidine triad (HIT) family protein